MKISRENSVDYFHSWVENQIQICAKLSSLLFKVLTSQEKKKLKARKTLVGHVHQPISLGWAKPPRLQTDTVVKETMTKQGRGPGSIPTLSHPEKVDLLLPKNLRRT